MKKLFSVLVVLLCLTLISPVLAQDFDLDETYDNDVITFDYPEDWDIDEETDVTYLTPDGDDVDDFEDVEIGFYYSAELLEVLGIEDDMDAEEALEVAAELLELDEDDIEVDAIGDNDVASIAYEVDEDLYYISSIVDTGDGLLLAEISGEEDQVDEAEDIYFDILATLSFSDNGSSGDSDLLTESYESDNEELTFDLPDDWDIEDVGLEIYVTPDSDDFEDIEDVEISFVLFNEGLEDRFGIEVDDDIDDIADDIMDTMEDDGIDADSDGDIIEIGDYDVIIVRTEIDGGLVYDIAVVETDEGVVFVQIFGPEDQVEDDLAQEIFFGMIASMEWNP